MKKAAIFIITFYQQAISVILKNIFGTKSFCRFFPTCSEYAKREILEKGALKGTCLSILRILKCHPYYKPYV